MGYGVSKEIIKAIDHVREVFPEVEIVVFNKEGRWQYLDSDFGAPKFDERIDQSILEAAADAVDVLPFVYQI